MTCLFFFHIGIACFIPAHITRTLLAIFLSLGNIVLKSHGCRVTGVGLEICIFTPRQLIQGSPTNQECPSCCFLELDDTSSLLKFYLLISERKTKPASSEIVLRLKCDGLLPDPLKVFAQTIPSQEGLLDHLTETPSPDSSLYSTFLPCFMLLLFLLRSLLNLFSNIFLSSLELPVFSGLPGHLAYPFIHRKLSLFWATQMLEKTNKMTSKITQAR